MESLNRLRVVEVVAHPGGVAGVGYGHEVLEAEDHRRASGSPAGSQTVPTPDGLFIANAL